MRTREVVWGGIGLVAAYGIGRALIHRIDKATVENGTPGGVKVLLNERNAHAKPTWEGDKEATKSIISNPEKAVIFVSNHPNTLEPFFLLSELPPRQNLSLIAKSGGERVFGEIFRKNMIPVDTIPRWETKGGKRKRQERNNKQLDEAVRRLHNHEGILVAPDGGDGSGDWKKGSARLIEGALEMPEAYLLMAHIPSSTPNEHIRLAFKRKLERNVRISELINVHDLPLPQEVKQMPSQSKEKLLLIGKHMKEYYNNWAEENI